MSDVTGMAARRDIETDLAGAAVPIPDEGVEGRDRDEGSA